MHRWESLAFIMLGNENLEYHSCRLHLYITWLLIDGVMQSQQIILAGNALMYDAADNLTKHLGWNLEDSVMANQCIVGQQCWGEMRKLSILTCMYSLLKLCCIYYSSFIILLQIYCQICQYRVGLVRVLVVTCYYHCQEIVRLFCSYSYFYHCSLPSIAVNTYYSSVSNTEQPSNDDDQRVTWLFEERTV